MMHVMNRLCPVTEYMLREARDRSQISSLSYVENDEAELEKSTMESVEQAMDISQNPQFRQLIRRVFEKFVQKCSDSAISKCRDDLTAITKYVTWNLNERSSGALSRALPDQTNMIAVYQVALDSTKKGA